MSTPADKIECVGSLLVHSSDLQDLAHTATANNQECIGSLLVHSSDMQELSEKAAAPHFPEMGSPNVNLKKRVTVGTLLVSPEEVKTHEEPNREKGSARLVRRVTECLQGPSPDDAESDLWAD